MIPASWYTNLAIGLGAVAVLAACVIGVVRAVDGIYDRGHKAGQAELKAHYQEKLLKAQDEALKQQQTIFAQSQQYTALQHKYAALEVSSPKEVIREVRQDPVFASARRPTELHARRVRELDELRQIAGHPPAAR